MEKNPRKKKFWIILPPNSGESRCTLHPEGRKVILHPEGRKVTLPPSNKGEQEIFRVNKGCNWIQNGIKVMN